MEDSELHNFIAEFPENIGMRCKVMDMRRLLEQNSIDLHK